MARQTLGLPMSMNLIDVCAHLLAAYERTYPEIKKDWYDDIKRTIAITHKLVSPLGWTRHFFGDPRTNKPALNAAVAHGPQNLSNHIVNKGYYKTWRESVYNPFIRGRLRVKAPIHDSILYCYKGEDIPHLVKEWMTIPVQVKDIKGKTRTMVIHPEISIGKNKAAKFWSELK
jgi:hypothetical protein